MAIGLIGGISNALVAGSAEYQKKSEEERARKRIEGIQDVALGRQTTLWNEQQATKRAEEDEANEEVKGWLDPSSPFPAIDQLGQIGASPSQQAPATVPQQAQGVPQAQPIAPGIASPFSNLPIVTANPTPFQNQGATTPRGIAQIGAQGQVPAQIGAQGQPAAQGQAQPVQQPQAQAPAQEPKPYVPATPEAAALDQQYQAIRNRISDAIQKIDARTAGDPEANRRQRAAYMKVVKESPDYKTYEEGFTKYRDAAIGAVATKKSREFVSLVRQLNIPAIERMLGVRGITIGRDPFTQMQGIRLPNGTYMGADDLEIDAMEQARLISATDASKRHIEILKDNAKLMSDYLNNQTKEKLKTMPNISVTVTSPQGNREIQAADELQRAVEERARRKQAGMKDDDPVIQGLDKKIANLSYKATGAETKATQAENTWLLKLTGQKLNRVNTLIKQSLPKYDSTTGVPVPNTGVDGKTAVQNFLKLQKDDPTGDMAFAYRHGLSGDLGTAIDDEINRQAEVQRQKDMTSATESPMLRKKGASVSSASSAPQGGKTVAPEGTRVRMADGTIQVKRNGIWVKE